MYCYKAESKVEAWEDEKAVDLAANAGTVWLYEALLHHPQRTTDPAQATLFVLPIESFVSEKLRKTCNRKDHARRAKDITKLLAKAPYLLRNGGAGAFLSRSGEEERRRRRSGRRRRRRRRPHH